MTPRFDLVVLLAASHEQKSQNLEALGLLTRSTTHDLNNQMVAILGFAQMTLEALPPGDPLRENLEEIRQQGERAVAKTRELAKAGRMLSPLGSRS